MSARERFSIEIASRDWSNADAARKLDCAPSYITGMKNGQVTPGLALAARIEKVLGIPCAEWVAGKTPVPSERRQGRTRRSG